MGGSWGSVQGQHSDPVRSERLGLGAGRFPVTLTFPHTGCDAGPRWTMPGQRMSLLTCPALLLLPDLREGSPWLQSLAPCFPTFQITPKHYEKPISSEKIQKWPVGI